MRIIVINLDRDPDRLAHMSGQLERLGLEYERFAALRGDDLPDELRAYFDPKAPLSAGETGCYASHLAICRRVASGDLRSPVLVLEDDVGLPDGLAATLEVLVSALPVGWDIVRLSYPTKRLWLPLAELGGGYELVRYSQTPTSTGAYLISASGAGKFLKARKRRLPIDHDLRRVWAWNLDSYGVMPAPVRADVLAGSSIDALSPGARDPARRSAARRRQRAIESAARFVRGARDFGLGRWVAMETFNFAARFTPRRARGALYALARSRLA